MPPVHLPIPSPADLVLIERCDPPVRLRRLIELGVVHHLLTEIVSTKGLTITVEDGDDEPVKRCTDIEAIVDAIFAVDDCKLTVHKPGPRGGALGVIRLVLGNDGWDVISDYTTNLEDLLAPTNAYAEALSAWC